VQDAAASAGAAAVATSSSKIPPSQTLRTCQLQGSARRFSPSSYTRKQHSTSCTSGPSLTQQLPRLAWFVWTFSTSPPNMCMTWAAGPTLASST
jgi:hypothetical protein